MTTIHVHTVVNLFYSTEEKVFRRVDIYFWGGIYLYNFFFLGGVFFYYSHIY